MLKSVAQAVGLLVGGLAVFASVIAVLTTVIAVKLPATLVMLAVTLVALAGVIGLVRGRAWGALLLAFWAALAAGLLTISFLGILGIEGIRVPFVVAGLIEVGVAIAIAMAPETETG